MPWKGRKCWGVVVWWLSNSIVPLRAKQVPSQTRLSAFGLGLGCPGQGSNSGSVLMDNNPVCVYTLHMHFQPEFCSARIYYNVRNAMYCVTSFHINSGICNACLKIIKCETCICVRTCLVLLRYAQAVYPLGANHTHGNDHLGCPLAKHSGSHDHDHDQRNQSHY